MIKKNYISNKDKKYIENYCLVQMEQGDLIRPKSVMCLLEDKYAVCEVLQYIRNDLGIDNKYIWRGNTTNYIIELPRGHIQLINDVYFNNCYLHQYVICKELDLDIKEVQKYIIHHIDQNKGNNDISNLWVFYDIASHIAYHQVLKHGDVDIKQFTENYIESIINNKNVTEIKQYLEILDKLERTKNKKCLSTPIDKHSKN